ncbi:MAG TPA: peptidoglycan-binding protein, partial [Bacteroidetes bacterium]|nr:peptidoglycan-binding protein [Bacteroidota bacterium]
MEKDQLQKANKRPNFLGDEAEETGGGKTLAAPPFSLEASEGDNGDDLAVPNGNRLPGDANLAARRFRGTVALKEIREGSRTVRVGTQSLPVYKLQRALSELSFLSASEITGTFNATTKTALIAYERANHIHVDGEFDAETLFALEKSYKDRSIYKDLATKEPHDEPTSINRNLGKYVEKVLSGRIGEGGTSRIFTEEVEVDGKTFNYKDLLAKRMKGLLRKHYRSYRKNRRDRRQKGSLYKWNQIEGPMAASTTAVNQLYGSWNQSGAPAKTHANGGLKDQWVKMKRKRRNLEADKRENPGTDKAKEVAKRFLEGLIIGKTFSSIHRKFKASFSGAREKVIMAEVVAEQT